MKRQLCAALLIACALLYAPSAQGANDITSGRTWILDTTGSITTSALDIDWIIWTGCTTAGHDLILRTASGGEYILQDLDGEAGKTKIFYVYDRYPGLYLDTLGSGKLIIKLR